MTGRSTDDADSRGPAEADGGRPDDPNRQRADDADPGRPEETSLDALREEIETIDRELVELIAQRTYVADSIARVKAAEGLPTVDEAQEARVMERAGENADRFDVDANLVKAIFRLLIELNKVEQRSNR